MVQGQGVWQNFLQKADCQLLRIPIVKGTEQGVPHSLCYTDQMSPFKSNKWESVKGKGEN